MEHSSSIIVNSSRHQSQSGSNQFQSSSNQLKSGSDQLQSGSNQLQSGLNQSQFGSNQLQSGSNQLQSGSSNEHSSSIGQSHSGLKLNEEVKRIDLHLDPVSSELPMPRPIQTTSVRLGATSSSVSRKPVHDRMDDYVDRSAVKGSSSREESSADDRKLVHQQVDKDPGIYFSVSIVFESIVFS